MPVRVRKSIVFFAVFICSVRFAQANALPQYFNFDGYLTDANDYPRGGPVDLKFQIYNPGEDCLLYEETQQNVALNNLGEFSVKVGAGDRSSSAVDGGGSYAKIFQNDSTPRTTTGATCPTLYAPASGDTRKLRVLVNGVALTPSFAMSPSPMATVAETLQGAVPADFVSVSSSAKQKVDKGLKLGDTLQLLDTTGNRYVELKTPAGVAASYTLTLPTSLPSSAKLLQADAAGVLSWVGATTGVSSVTSPSTAAGVNIVTSTSTGASTLTLKTVAEAYPSPAPAPNPTGSYGSASAYPVITVDTYGRVTAASTLSLPGKAVTGPTPSAGTLDFQELGANGSQMVTLKSPDSISTNFTLTLPTSAGTAGQFLTTDGTGVLSWSGSTTGVTSVNQLGGDPSIAMSTTAGVVSLKLADLSTPPTGTYGNNSLIPQIVVDAKGRVTAVTNKNLVLDAAAGGAKSFVLKASTLSVNRMWNLPDSDGVAGYLLSTDGAGNLSWITPPAGNAGTVTSVTAGSGLTGGTITNTGTISVPTGGIISTHILDGTIGTADIASLAVTDGKINSVDVGKITNSMTTYFSYMPALVPCTSGQTLKWDTVNVRWVCGVDNTGVADSDGNTKIIPEQSANEDYLRFFTNGIERAYINNSGRMGIGMLTAPLNDIFTVGGSGASSSITSQVASNNQADAPYFRMARARGSLSAQSDTGYGDTLGVVDFNFRGGGTFNTAAKIVAETPPYGTVPTEGRLSFWTTPIATTVPISRMRIESNGNVGFNFPSNKPPEEQLEIFGTVPSAMAMTMINDNVNDASRIELKRARNTIASPFPVMMNDLLGSIAFRGYSTTSAYETYAKIQAFATANPTGGSTPGKMVFYTTPVGTTTPVARMNIDPAGKVTMGTLGDTAPVEVQGKNQILYSAGPDLVLDAPVFSIRRSLASDGMSPVTSSAYIGFLNFEGKDTTSTFTNRASIGAVVSGSVSNGNVPTDLFFTTGSTVNTERMRITSGGQVGIGTTAPLATLDVNGWVKLKAYNTPPIACTGTNYGSIALTSNYIACICLPAGWKLLSSDGNTVCSW